VPDILSKTPEENAHQAGGGLCKATATSKHSYDSMGDVACCFILRYVETQLDSVGNAMGHSFEH